MLNTTHVHRMSPSAAEACWMLTVESACRCPGERGDAGPALGSRTDASDAPSEQLALQRSVQHLSKQGKMLKPDGLMAVTTPSW